MRAAARRTGRGHRPFVVLVVGIAMTVTAVAGVHGYMQTRDQARFENAVRATEDRIAARFDAYIALLLATRGMFVAQQHLGIDEFGRYAMQLELATTYPGIQGVGFSRRFAWDERGSVEAEMRAAGLETFQVWPDHERSEGHAIVLLEPQDTRNRAALGFDMFTEPVRREAMEHARDSGRPVASGRVTLVQEIGSNKQAGFLVYLPLYAHGTTPATVEERRANLRGFVYSPFRADDLFFGIFGREVEPRVGFAVYDQVVSPATIMYRTGAVPPKAPQLSTRTEITIADRPWHVELWTLPAFERGSTRWILPLIGVGGVLASLLVFMLARVRERADRELLLHSRILASMSEGVSVTDERGTILYTNPAEDKMFGYERGELLGQPMTVQNTYPPDENARVVEQVIATLRQRGEWTGEFSNVKKDGTKFTTSARITALDLGGRPVWVCVQEDVTERKRTEAERTALLEREQASRVAAEAANRTKDEFLAMLGHELRNPLAPIVTALEVIDQRYGRERFREHDVIERQVRHLRRMVDDLLDVSAIARGKVSLATRRIEIASIVRLACELAGPLLEERRHQLIVDVPQAGLDIDGDEARLVQVFANLLTNAAKYTDPGGRIEILADVFGDRVRVRVRDNGIGIEPGDLERVFELFAQAERRLDRSRGGLGVGLSLAKSLVELHGGTIEARSAGRGKGSEMIVCLPPSATVTDDAQPSVTAPQRESRGPSRRVIVVDDNVDAADMLAELLREAGHHVDVAYDAPEALALAERSPPDIAILDIGLPAMDGYELAGRLSVVRRPILIALTGYGRDHDKQRSAEAGFAHHLVKPVSPARLLELIDASVEQTS
jgi:PAS domain S-box-containing protein